MGLADLTLAVEQHEALAELDEDHYVARLERNRATKRRAAGSRGRQACEQRRAKDTDRMRAGRERVPRRSLGLSPGKLHRRTSPTEGGS